MESANLLQHEARWFYTSPFGIVHHSARSSRVLISGRGFFIICLIGTFVRGISLSLCCFAAFAFSSPYWNTIFRAFVSKLWKAAWWWFDYQYACLRSIIALSGSSELAFKRLPSWPIWSEEWFRRCIFSKLKSISWTRCCAISVLICVWFSSTHLRFAAAERLCQAGSHSRSFCLSKVSCFFKASVTFFVDLPAGHGVRWFLWQWNYSR